MFIRPYINICGKNYVVMPVILWVFGKLPDPPCTIFNVEANNHSPNDAGWGSGGMANAMVLDTPPVHHFQCIGE
jgi:hypothetical protein